MKKGIKILMLLVLALLISSPYSCKNRVKDQDAAGTIGKVEKYRKDQMKDSDIVLRSEIMEDTSKLKGTINGLIVYSAYSKTLSQCIDDQVTELGYCGCYENESDLTVMKDFSEFIENNEATMDNTITMLVDFYNDDVSESSFDVESNLRNFVNYVGQLEEKSEALDMVIGGMDEFIAENIGTDEKAEKIDQLKGIRDNLLLRNMQGAIVMNDVDKINSIYSNQVIYNTETLQYVFSAMDGLNYNIGEEVLGAYNATGELNSFLNAAMSQEILSAVLFDQGFVGNLVILNDHIELADIEGLGVLPPGVLGAGGPELDASQSEMGDMEEMGKGITPVLAQDGLGVAGIPAAVQQLNSALNSFSAFSSDLNSMEGLNIIRPS